jgi:hypothetical protein
MKKKVLVYTTLTKQSSWPKEWAEYEEFREHWQELKQILGKQLPGCYISTRINRNLVITVIAVKNGHDIFNYQKAMGILKEEYPVSEFINLKDYSSLG